MQPNRSHYFLISHLKKGGWTDRLIDRLLGEPDLVESTSRSGRTVRKWEIGRVMEATKSAEFQEHYEPWNARRKARDAAYTAKWRQAEEYAATVEIDIPRMSEDELIRRAILAHEAQHGAGKGSSMRPYERQVVCVRYLLQGTYQALQRLIEILDNDYTEQLRLKLLANSLIEIEGLYPFLADCCKYEVRKAWSKIIPG